MVADRQELFGVFNRGLRRFSRLEIFLAGAVARSTLFVPKGLTATAGWGRREYARKARRIAQAQHIPFICLEDGFLRSVALGRSDPPLAIVIDDLGIYYDADSPSRLENLICQPRTDAEINRSRSLVSAWRGGRVSKYNHAREFSGTLPVPYVLVVDQTFGDAAIRHGRADLASFQRMLAAALAEYPAATVLLKVHPEVLSGRKRGHFDLAALGKSPRVQVLAEDLHPVALIEQAEAIYTVTSQVGFEGLLWGKPVRTFGMPFYAGWGLTGDDLLAPPRRQLVPLENLVHAALIDYSRYVDPESGQRCEVETVLAHLALQRRLRGRFPATVHAVGFSRWKRPIVRDYFFGSTVKFHRQAQSLPATATVAVWGRKDVYPSLTDTANEAHDSLPPFQGEGRGGDGVNCLGTEQAHPHPNLPLEGEGIKNFSTKIEFEGEGAVIRLEDGFLRSVGLGADLVRPLSWVMDQRGIYYDATQPSDLEYLLQNTVFDAELLMRARHLRDKIVTAGLTKYNVGVGSWQRPMAAGRVILVPGQVESDASIRYGAPGIATNMGLLAAVRLANPGAYLIYKPHPDVLAGLRASGAGEEVARAQCDEIVADVAMSSLLAAVDEVHVMTSLAGFEALLRGKQVVTYGQPFYAGWGLTSDLSPPLRRTRRLTLEELVAGVLIEYPVYLSRSSGRFTTPERALEELLLWREEGSSRLPLWRRLWRLIVKSGVLGK